MGILDPKKFSTQDHLDIEDIRDNFVVLKNGRVSAVLETTAINFDLLDGAEQDARIGSFAAFLNSIRFPIQIVVKTQRTDIAKYLQLLDQYKQKITSDSLFDQVSLYQDFISNLTQTAQILDKRFFIVIPSLRMPIITTSWIKQILGKQERIINLAELVEKAKDELEPKIDSFIKLFSGIGVKATQLRNDELIRLYYSVYEPDQRGMGIKTFREEDLETGLVGLERQI